MSFSPAYLDFFQVDDYVEELYEYRWSLEWAPCDGGDGSPEDRTAAAATAAALCQAGFGDSAAADLPDGDAALSPLDAECLGYIPETDTVMEYRYHLEKGELYLVKAFFIGQKFAAFTNWDLEEY